MWPFKTDTTITYLDDENDILRKLELADKLEKKGVAKIERKIKRIEKRQVFLKKCIDYLQKLINKLSENG